MTKWELYDTAYTERYLGNPAVDPKPYQSSDALDDAVKIRDPLLLVHGMSDDNVVFQNSTELYARLQQAKKPFEMMAYPGATHAIAGEGPQTHVWTTITALPRRQGARKNAAIVASQLTRRPPSDWRSISRV